MPYFKATTLHKCLICLPEGFKQEGNYTLVVGLHGGGSKPESMTGLWDKIPDRQFIFAVPQGPYPFMNAGELVYDWGMWPSQDAEAIQAAAPLTELYILDAVKDLTSRYKINQTYLMGFSQGAIFTYLTGIKHHHLFEGIICLSGPGLLSRLKNPFVQSFGSEWLPKKHIQAASRLRVMITHGTYDPAAGYELGLQSRDILSDHGYQVTFHEFEGGHSYPPESVLISIKEWINSKN